MAKVNGLTPEENAATYLKIVAWYSKPVDIYQAAKECGIEPEKFVNSFNFTNEIFAGVDKIPGRIKLMLHPDRPIPVQRNIWESPGRDGIPGMFQQAMILFIWSYGYSRRRNRRSRSRRSSY